MPAGSPRSAGKHLREHSVGLHAQAPCACDRAVAVDHKVCANWTPLGLTKGRGKDDHTNRQNRSLKLLFGYPLVRDFSTTSVRGRRFRAGCAPGDRMTKPEDPTLAFDVEFMRDLVSRLRGRLSPQDLACLADVVEVMAELRTLVMEADDDAPVDESLLALAIERARARTSK
jgi:hypothetical protein